MMNALAPTREITAATWSLLAGWRFVLAVIVVICHLTVFLEPGQRAWLRWIQLIGGHDAVLCFLLISGASIASSYKRQAGGFYRRRMRRIIPVYGIALFLGIAVSVVAGGSIAVNEVEFPAPTFGQAVGNVFFLQGITCDTIASNNVLWTLSLEVWLYLLTPILAKSSRLCVGMFTVSGFLYVLSYTLGIGVWWDLRWGGAFVFLAWPWLAAFFYIFHTGRSLAGGVLFVMTVATIYCLNPHTHGRVGMLLALVTLGLLILDPPSTLHPGSGKLLDALGDLSFPLYAFHYPLFIAGWSFLGLHNLTLAVFVGALILSPCFLAKMRSVCARPVNSGSSSAIS